MLAGALVMAMGVGSATNTSGSGPGADVSSDLASLVCAYDWPCSEALSVAFCESRYLPWAENGRYKGLFQVGSDWAPVFGVTVEQLLDAETNIWVAYQLWRRSGWQPWACSPY